VEGKLNCHFWPWWRWWRWWWWWWWYVFWCQWTVGYLFVSL